MSQNDLSKKVENDTIIIYNVTVKLHQNIATEWIHWLKTEHIPEIIQTECFFKAQILKLIETDDEDSITFAIQYHAPSINHYKKYIDQYSSIMRQKGYEKWGNQFIAFRTVMQVVN